MANTRTLQKRANAQVISERQLSRNEFFILSRDAMTQHLWCEGQDTRALRLLPMLMMKYTALRRAVFRLTIATQIQPQEGIVIDLFRCIKLSYTENWSIGV